MAEIARIESQKWFMEGTIEDSNGYVLALGKSLFVEAKFDLRLWWRSFKFGLCRVWNLLCFLILWRAAKDSLASPGRLDWQWQCREAFCVPPSLCIGPQQRALSCAFLGLMGNLCFLWPLSNEQWEWKDTVVGIVGLVWFSCISGHDGFKMKAAMLHEGGELHGSSTVEHTTSLKWWNARETYSVNLEYGSAAMSWHPSSRAQSILCPQRLY